MAYSTESKTAAHTAKIESGKYPFYVGKNLIADYNTAAVSMESGTWTTGTSVKTDLGQLHDDNPSSMFELGYTVDASNPGYILFDLNNIEFDFIAILGHNFGELADTGINIDVEFQIADNSIYTNHLLTVFDSNDGFVIKNNFRMIKIDTENSYKNVRYARLKILPDGATTNGADVHIGQIFVGKYVMPLATRPFPINSYYYETQETEHVSDAGGLTVYTNGDPLFAMNAELVFTDSADLEEFEQFLYDIRNGGKPFYYCPDATQTDDDNVESIRAYFMMSDDEIRIYKDDNGNRRYFELNAIEIGQQCFASDLVNSDRYS